MANNAVSYLAIYLDPLAKHLGRTDVTDVYVNQPGEIWTETLGGEIERHDVPELSEALLGRLARQIASVTHQGISRENPLLAASLPDGARVQVVAPPATRGPLALAIRKQVSAHMSLTDYHASGALDDVRPSHAEDPREAHLRKLYQAQDWIGFLSAAVRARKTIVVSGGTSSGKTTFLNALLREIDPAERLILIEDTPELEIQNENAVGLLASRSALGEASVTTDDLLLASLRMRPDRIILGELRGVEAFSFLRAINTGHPGSLTTIHADSPARAVEQLALMVLQSRTQLKREDVTTYVESAVDVFVQLERRDGKRRVSHIDWKEHKAEGTAGP